MTRLRRRLLAPYHYAWAVLSTLWYGFPAKRLTVIGVTGTKGKSSVAEMLYTILAYAGHPTALAGTIRFALGAESRPNLFKMTLPGRGFIQKFLAEAAAKNCTHAVIEITSEAALQYRHFGLDLDALIFTNLHKEHLESHGSEEKYFRAKFAIGEALVRSGKRPRSIIANADDARGKAFLSLPVEKRIPFSLADASDTHSDERGVSFSYNGTHFMLSLPGTFNIVNALAAIKTAEAFGIPLETCAQALGNLSRISGRVERIEAGQDFIAVVDYAHTSDSLAALYGAFPNQRKICVLGNTGGGRDTWKRPEMGRIADETCAEVILTNEDPYDEDPRAIVDAMAAGMKRAPLIIMDRREAIRAAIRAARPGDAVLISGKGTDPFIMGPNGGREPWSDASVVREELGRLLAEV
ncbi:UDP-N-acetylmuramyl-tripeptide synthetase [Patescibacteria group bacterium]|nr:UDP-N-acetylmuramyl-tripeptide synthetase [Patescibacteria group bacterium]